MRAATPLLLPPVLGLAACAVHEPLRGSLEGRIFSAAIAGDVTITQGGAPGSGTRLDLRDDLDLDGSTTLELAGDVELAGVRAGLAWLPLSFDGAETLDRAETFHGTTFPAGSRVKSELDLPTWRLRVDAPLLDDGRGALRAGLGAYWWTLDMELRDVDTGVSDSREFSRLLPAVTISSSWRVSRGVTAGFDAAFAAIDEGRRLWDFDATARCSVHRGLTVHAGFRFRRYELQEDTNDGVIDLFGPLVGMQWRF